MKPINKFFRTKGSIPLDKFLAKVLYDKRYGYYSKKNPFGQKGDFVTSPIISSLFSEMIGIWLLYYWENLNKPRVFNIVELGPGGGELCNVLIKMFKKFPEFSKCIKIFLYENSRSLKKVQKKKINKKNIKWISSFNSIKKGPVIFFGNEFFDAIPIKQFEIKDRLVYEKFIQMNKNFQIETILKKANKSEIKILKKFYPLKNKDLIEFPKLGLKILDTIVSKIKRLGGGILLIDYGYVKKQNLSTLQSVKNHKTNKVFENLGEADITSLVNFTMLKDYFNNKGLFASNIVSQNFFLSRLGILSRAEILSKKMNFKDKADLYYRLKRLLDTKFMGNIFKVICAFKDKKKNILGFN